MLSEPVLVVAKIASVFDALGIRYVVGGSLASSVYGIPRATARQPGLGPTLDVADLLSRARRQR